MTGWHVMGIVLVVAALGVGAGKFIGWLCDRMTGSDLENLP